MSAFLVLLKSRIRVIGAHVGLVVWCSCASSSNRLPDHFLRPKLPAEEFFNNEAGQIYVTVSVENGEAGLFSVDTGLPITMYLQRRSVGPLPAGGSSTDGDARDHRSDCKRFRL